MVPITSSTILLFHKKLQDQRDRPLFILFRQL